ncbi:lipopolysaccharide-induced tumor necrosis factor LITAF [Acrasis kona]|uniref:Lipopolysaccharide-induced tumor necrosis factor LITAF n=1 Tax=Acrasis kona TaxID=1008807 RepID=A0AAW2Z0T9_9EUKA
MDQQQYPPQQQQQYPPQQQQFVGVSPQASNVTYVVTNQNSFGTTPCAFTCSNCGYQGQTYTSTEVGAFAILMALVLFVLGFWCCCWIPLVLDGCKDTSHSCPQCKRVVGTKTVM